MIWLRSDYRSGLSRGFDLLLKKEAPSSAISYAISFLLDVIMPWLFFDRILKKPPRMTPAWTAVLTTSLSRKSQHQSLALTKGTL